MSAVFTFAKCSYCKRQLYDEAEPAKERHGWLGACGHRICHFCSVAWLSQASVCPLCTVHVPFKRLKFSDATNVVELLCSALSELTNRINSVQNLFLHSNPILPPPVPNLFSEPLFNSSTLPLEDHHPLYSAPSTLEAPQNTQMFPTTFPPPFLDRPTSSAPPIPPISQTKPHPPESHSWKPHTPLSKKHLDFSQYAAEPFGSPSNRDKTQKETHLPDHKPLEPQPRPISKKTPIRALAGSKTSTSQSSSAKKKTSAFLAGLRAQYD